MIIDTKKAIINLLQTGDYHAYSSSKKMELINKIAKLPEQKIAEVDVFIQKLLAQLQFKKPVPISLKGIWKNKGFEKIVDLETEIKNIRRELDDSILKKAF